MLDKMLRVRGIMKSNWFTHKSICLLAVALISGCANSVVVKPDIPRPLVERLDLKTNLVFTDTFNDYVYLESEKKRGSLKSLNFADAQTTMFRQVFSSVTNLVEEGSSEYDLAIEPEILDFQYSEPSETKLKQYEIWIKYRLKLLNNTEDSIADWTIKGYGKTPTGLLTSASSAFNAATNIALRDVGAQLSIRFPKQRVIKTLVDGGTPRVIATKAERIRQELDKKAAEEQKAKDRAAEAIAAKERREKEKQARKDKRKNKTKNKSDEVKEAEGVVDEADAAQEGQVASEKVKENEAPTFEEPLVEQEPSADQEPDTND